MRSRTRALATGVSLTLMCALAACGNSSAAATGNAAATGAGSSITSKWPPSPKGTWGKEPTVVVPSSKPPTKLVEEDLIDGTGATAKDGDTVTVQYVGVSYTTKKVFDASWERHQTFSFLLGAHQVIAGWDEGVKGMRVGGRRELIIPPSLAYGSSSPGPGIVANDTLIFIVDLVKVQAPA